MRTLTASWSALVATAAAATALGIAGHLSGFPAGALVGALIGAALVSWWRPVRVPATAASSARWLIGAVAGSGITMEGARSLGPTLLWGTIASLLTIAAGVGGGMWAARVTGLDRPSSVVAVVPGGLSELTGLANEFDLRSDVVIAVHLVRRLGVVSLVVAILASTG